MDNRATKYIHEQVAATGFVLTSAKWAATCSPANYGNGQSALSLEGSPGLSAEMKRLNTKPYRVDFKDGSMAVCWSRSPAGLAQRIEWLTGAIVDEVSQIIESIEPSRSKPALSEAQRKKAANDAHIRKVAAEDPPSHDCALRRQILNSREIVRIMDEQEAQHAD